MAEEKKLNMICVDGSQHGEKAFRYYFDNCHKEGDRVGLVTIHELPYVPIGLYEDGLMLSEAAYPTLLEDSIREAKGICDKFKTRCLDLKVKPEIYCVTAEDSIGNTICKLAKENNASLIVVGQRGLGAIRRTFLGSVSDYVIHHAHIPTIVVPTSQ